MEKMDAMIKAGGRGGNTLALELTETRELMSFLKNGWTRVGGNGNAVEATFHRWSRPEGAY